MPTKGWKQRRAERLGLPWPAPQRLRPPRPYSAAAVAKYADTAELLDPTQAVAEHAADPTALREWERLEKDEWL